MKNLIITREYPGLIDEGYRYKIEGNLSSQASIDIQLDNGLFVDGYIDAGGSIKVGWYIKAGESIGAGEYIKAGSGILACLSITCKTRLSAQLGIFAGVCIWKNPSEREQTITCGQLDGTVKYGILKLTGENSTNLDDVLVEHIKMCHLHSCKYPHEGRSCEECEHFKCIDRCPRCGQEKLLAWQRNELLGKNERLGVMEFINNSKYEFTNIDNEMFSISY